MNKPQEIANYIILEAYKNNGEIEFKKLNMHIDWQILAQVNKILKSYGSLYAELSNETWHSYSLSAYGVDFASQGAFQGLEKERQQKADDRWLDRKYKWFCILAVIIAFASLVVSIIAIWPQLQ